MNIIHKLKASFRKKTNHISSPSTCPNNEKFVLFEYWDNEGKFDYEKYRNIQIEGNHQKINKVWVIRENIDFLSDYLRKNLQDVSRGICHGTRRGYEQLWFRENLECDVIGTEISDTASQFPYTIQWDFHDIKSEWIEAFDFIYSNSLDHSYNPQMCIQNWMKCLNKNGICIIEHTSLHSPEGATLLDPFGATIEYMPYLISRWGCRSFGVYEILEAPKQKDSVSYNYFIVLRKFN